MKSQKKFPLTLQLPMPFEAHVYPSPEGGRGVTVRGQGNITLTFEKPKRLNIAHVRIEDIWVKLGPTRIPFDIDRDGQLECIDIEGMQFGAEALDLEKSGGEYNLESHRILIKFVFSVSPEALKPVGKKLGLEPIHFEIAERGWLDLETGAFSTHSGIFTLPKGPFTGLTIMGHQGCGHIECDSTVALGVLVLTPGSPTPDIPAGQAPKEVWICPRTPIVLLWQSSNADNVEINPDLGVRPPNGWQSIPDPSSPNPNLRLPIDRNMKYTADTKSQYCSTAHDEVDINVVRGGEEFPQSAVYNREYLYWVAHLPAHCYDPNIKVYEVIIDTGQKNSVTHPSWRLDHMFPKEPTVGTMIPALNNWTTTPYSFSLPGEYRFTPMPPGTKLPTGDQQRTLYFRLRLKCKI